MSLGCRNDPVGNLDRDRLSAAVAPVRAAQPLAPCIHAGSPADRSNAGIAGNSWGRNVAPYGTNGSVVSGFLITGRNCWIAAFHSASICAIAAAICAGVPPAPSGEVGCGTCA